jgi:tetratricopeptide (TPR) repeat protein
MEKGDALRLSENFSGAITAFQQAIKILEPSQTELLALASALNSLATTYDDMGRAVEAENYYHRAVDVATKAAGPHSVSRAQILVNLGCGYLHRGELAKTEKILGEALGIYIDLLPPTSPKIAVARGYLAASFLSRGLFDEAADLFDKAIPILEKNGTDQEGIYGMALNNKGSLRWEQNRHDEAIQLYRQSLSVLEQVRGADSPALLYPLNNLASAQFQTGHTDEAFNLYTRAMRIAEINLGPYRTLYGVLLKNYAACLKQTGHKAEAKKFEARAARAAKESAQIDGSAFTVSINSLLPAKR